MADKQLSFICLGRFSIGGVDSHVTLTRSSISWQKDSKTHTEGGITLPLSRILAVIPCDCSPKQKSTCQYCRQTSNSRKNPADTSRATELLPLNTQAFKIHYSAPKGKFLWRLSSIVMYPLDDSDTKEWISLIRNTLQDLTTRVRSLLIFVNPHGGKKKAQTIYTSKVAPLFQLAGIKTEVIVTERANHAHDIILDMALEKYDGIVAVGGDGMFSELLNGIVRKAQQEAWPTKGPDSALKRPNIPIGLIPAGSTDAIAHSTIGVNDVITSALLITMGDQIGVDVNSICHEGLFLRYSISFISYGYFGDVLVESEKHRWMGPARYDWAGLKTFLKCRTYKGELTMEVAKPAYVPCKHDRCIEGCPICARARSKFDQLNQSNESLSPESDWITVTGKFKAINSATITCCCAKTKVGISPNAHLGDGCADVILLKKCSCFQFLRYLIRLAINNASPLTLQNVEFYRVRQFHFSPYQVARDDPQATDSCSSNRSSVVALTNVLDSQRNVKTSSWNCDGEILKEPEISVRVHCQLVRIFSRGIEVREKSNNFFKSNFKQEP